MILDFKSRKINLLCEMDNTGMPCGCLFTRLPKLRAYYSEKKLRRSFGKIKTDGEAWLLYDPDKSGKWKERGVYKHLSCSHHVPRFMVGYAHDKRYCLQRLDN
jgi:hypothetical protein